MAKDKASKGKDEGNIASTSKAASVATTESTILQDARFQHLVSDPRFKSLPKTQRKVKIDKRFQTMFTDKKFGVKTTVDKYGRRINQSNTDDLRKFYELDEGASSDSEDEEQQKEKEEKAMKREAGEEETAIDDNGEDEESDASEDEESAKKLRDRLIDPDIDYARGEGRIMSDSSDDDDSSEDEGEVGAVEHVWGELDIDVDNTEESTRRLAVCNMDWDRIRATDIMVLLSSFLPRGGSVLSVKIYLSEFGKERLAEEEEFGPKELIGLGKEMVTKKKALGKSDSDDDIVPQQDSDAEEGDDYHMEKLRQYQLNRLRYYYAVVECDSVDTADKIYQECDGLEYESSATKVDLRFVPDETTFDEDEPTDVCNDLPNASNYKPRQFTTTALQQAKVDLTWDETGVERRELSDKLSSGKLDAVSDNDLRKILACSSDDEEDEDDDDEPNDMADGEEVKKNGKESKKKKDEDVIGKYKALLAEINEKEQKGKKQNYEMEFTWDVSANAKVETSTGAQATPQLTPIEKVMQKRNEKNKKRKEDRRQKKLQAAGIDPEAGSSDNDSDLPDGVDMNDPYFAEEFANGDYEQAKSKKPGKVDKQQKNKQASDAEEEEKRKATELELLLDDDDVVDKGKKHFSLDKIQKAEQETKSKRKRRQRLKKSKDDTNKGVEDDFQVDLNDERFKAVYTSHKFNIDPTDSHFKKTKGMDLIIDEKIKRRHGDANGNGKTVSDEKEPEDGSAKRPKLQLENSMLVKSLKRKIQLKQQGQGR